MNFIQALRSLQADRCVVLIGNRKWIREKNFIEIPADVENKLQVRENYLRSI